MSQCALAALFGKQQHLGRSHSYKLVHFYWDQGEWCVDGRGVSERSEIVSGGNKKFVIVFIYC